MPYREKSQGVVVRSPTKYRRVVKVDMASVESTFALITYVIHAFAFCRSDFSDLPQAVCRGLAIRMPIIFICNPGGRPQRQLSSSGDSYRE
jgi:hypothetical protein